MKNDEENDEEKKMIAQRLELLRIHFKLTKKEFAEQLNITQNSYTNYIQARRLVSHDVQMILVNKYNISLDWFITGRGEMIFNNFHFFDDDLSYALMDSIIISDTQSVTRLIKDFVFHKLFDPFKENKKQSFVNQIFSDIFSKSQRMILFFYKVLLHITLDNQLNLESIESPKDFLIERVRQFHLMSLENVGHGFTPFDKEKLIEILENYSDEECLIILKHIIEIMDVLKSKFSLINRFTY